MSAKDKKSEVFNHFEKAKGDFLIEVKLSLRTKGFQTLVICDDANVCMLETTHERSNRLCFAFFVWLAWAEPLAGIAKTATSK